MSIEIADEAFRTAKTLRGQSLQTAIAARSARAAVSDDGLRVLTRQAQDAVHQIAVLETNLAEQAAAPPDQRDDALARRLATQLQQLQAAREVILAEIKALFPKYAEQTHPRPDFPCRKPRVCSVLEKYYWPSTPLPPGPWSGAFPPKGHLFSMWLQPVAPISTEP